MLFTEYEKYECLNAIKQFLVAILLTSSIVVVQQSYAQSHQGAIEQPVGLVGLADYYFRHPEVFVGLHFDYKVTPINPQISSHQTNQL
jgi:hypothetical protein